MRDVQVIPGELQHRSVVVDLVKKKVVRKKATESRYKSKGTGKR